MSTHIVPATSQCETVAYFSMEVALESHIPTYSGGLGVLAGDTLRSAADLGLAMVGVTLVHRRGYFFQRLDAQGRQAEEAVGWSPDDWLEAADATADVEVEGRRVLIRAWIYRIKGAIGASVPVVLLDTDLSENDPYDRRLTDALYGGGARYRLCQEAVLGIGGVRMLRALGYHDVRTFHLNEGHSALLGLELLREELTTTGDLTQAIAGVAQRCVFTTHTPVPAGHDQFALDLARRVIGETRLDHLRHADAVNSTLNLTPVGLRFSHYVNGVTHRHAEVSRSLFPGYPIASITNGVHSVTWTAPAFRDLYDRHIPEWRRNPCSLRYVSRIPLDETRHAHEQAKRLLVQEVNERTNAGFDKDVLTLGFARRAAAYKRPGLLLHDLSRLRALARGHGGLQLVFAGKAHPQDRDGKAAIEAIMMAAHNLSPDVRVAYLANYDLALAQLVTAGVDVWLNTPRPPFEASGTSGMKAAHNGVPQLSILDGWWPEGYVQGMTGWAIGSDNSQLAATRTDAQDAADLYRILDADVAPLFADTQRWAALMRSTIAVNAAFFNSHRMLQEYLALAYRPVSLPLGVHARTGDASGAGNTSEVHHDRPLPARTGEDGHERRIQSEQQ